jgi:hypothetical protein
MAQVSGRNYLWRLLREIVRQAFQFSKDNVWPAVVAMATFLFQVVFGTSSSADFHRNALATLWAFLFAFGAYVLAQIIRAPFVLDRQRTDEIESLKKRLGDVVSVEFRSVTFQHPVPDKRNTRLRIDLVFRTSDAPATLGNWALRSEKTPTINPVWSNIWGFSHRLGGGSFRLEAHDHQSGAFTFDFMGEALATEDEIKDPLHRWVFTFTDAHRTYSEPIPAELFAKSV